MYAPRAAIEKQRRQETRAKIAEAVRVRDSLYTIQQLRW
jgi:hypothetical protein